jgi:hypothetical protein
MTANASLPLSPPASPPVTPVTDTPKINQLDEDELSLIADSDNEEPLEAGDETLFGSTTQRIGESKDSLMRAPDTRIFRQSEILHDIDYLIEKMNIEWCGPRGYAISIRARFFADEAKKEPNKVKFYCTRGRKYQTDLSNWNLEDLQNRGRLKRPHSTVQRCDCPFGGYFRRYAKSPDQWNLIITNETHNHDPVLDTRALPVLRRVCRNRGIQEIVEQKTQEGLPLTAIYDACLKTGLPVTKRDILNIQADIKVRRLNGLSPTQALLMRLGENPDYRYHFHVYEDGNLARLLVFERGSVEILRSNFEVLLVDSTYKTNRFNMPLFNIVGVTAINTSFFVGFCFLDTEDIETFEWVLKKLQELYNELGIQYPTTIVSDLDAAFLEARQIVFPQTNHLVCIWHVFKNILAHCKAEFKKDLAIKYPALPMEDVRTRVTATWEELLPDFQRVIYTKTIYEYETAWAAFQTKWLPKYPRIPTYIENTWLLKYKTMIVTAWTNHVLHFGNTATSRAERAHLVVKDAVHNSAGDLDKVLGHISAILHRQQEQYRAELARQAASRPKKLLNPIFRLVLERVSHKALFKTDEIVQRLRRLQEDHKGKNGNGDIPFQLDSCTYACVNSMGIPCIHRIKERIDHGPSLLLEDFHEHWRFERSLDRTPLDPRLFVKGPQEAMSKGRKKNRQQRSDNSTLRQPSKFEIVEAGLAGGEEKAVVRPAKRQRQDRTTVLPGGNLDYRPGGTLVKF